MLASAAARLSALGSIQLLGGGARIDAPNAQERPRGLIDDIGDWWRGDDNPADQDDSPAPPDSDASRKVSPGLERWRPSSFLPQPGSAAPGGPSSGSGARTANVAGNDFHINVAGSNASAADIARALGDELQGLMNSQFSDGAAT